MIKRIANHPALLASVMSLATFVAASHAYAGQSIMQDPSYLTYLRNNGFTIEAPARSDRHVVTDSYVAYMRLNGFTVEERKSAERATQQAGNGDYDTDPSYLAYRRLNGFI